MRNINLAFERSQRRSGRFLVLAGLLFVVLGSLMLTVVLFMKPEVKRPESLGDRIRLPIPSIEKEGEPGISGIVEKEDKGEKPLEGGILGEEKPIVPEAAEPSKDTLENGVGKKVFILGQKDTPKEEKEVPVDEREKQRPEIEGKEQGKAHVAMFEEPKASAIIEGKHPTGGFTVNIASFKDKGNADRLMRELEEKGYEVFVEKADVPQKGTWYRVSVGRFFSRKDALAFAKGLKEEGIDYSFVRKLD